LGIQTLAPAKAGATALGIIKDDFIYVNKEATLYGLALTGRVFRVYLESLRSPQ